MHRLERARYRPPRLFGWGFLVLRRGARVVDRGGLENRCAFAGTVGSNPTLSAIFSIFAIGLVQRAASDRTDSYSRMK